MDVTKAFLELINFKTQASNSFYTRLSPESNLYLLFMVMANKAYLCYDITEPKPNEKVVEELEKHFNVIQSRFQPIGAKKL